MTVAHVASNGGTAVHHEKPGVKGGCSESSSSTASPLYTMQAYFEGKMSVEEFARSEKERPTVAHNEFDETLPVPVIDVGALRTGTPKERQVNQVKQVEANGKEFFELPMECKLAMQALDFVFGYTGGSPIKWKSKWWLEGLMIKVYAQSYSEKK